MVTCHTHADHFLNFGSSDKEGVANQNFYHLVGSFEAYSFLGWHSLIPAHHDSLPLALGAHPTVATSSCGPLGTAAN